MAEFLEIVNLGVNFFLPNRIIQAVDSVSLKVSENEAVVLAGESGSGKTITALSIARILPHNARIVKGSITFLGQDMLGLDEESLISMRGRDVAYIFQEPTSYLNPVFTIGYQIAEAIILHQGKSKRQARPQAEELLRQVRIKEYARVLESYPHQLSGGMNQRVLLAMALACRPRLLIADEPTTSLDVTIEAEILRLLGELKERFGFSLLFITHSLAIAKKIADRIYVMHRGSIVEEGTSGKIFSEPQHFHTRELVSAYEKIGRLKG